MKFRKTQQKNAPKLTNLLQIDQIWIEPRNYYSSMMTKYTPPDLKIMNMIEQKQKQIQC